MPTDRLEQLQESMDDDARRMATLERRLTTVSDDLASLAKIYRDRRYRIIGVGIWAIGALAMGIAFLLVVRLGPLGYSYTDARYNRNELCAALSQHLPHFACPPIRRRGVIWNRMDEDTFLLDLVAPPESKHLGAE